MSTTFTEYVTLEKTTCWKCGVVFAMPQHLMKTLCELGKDGEFYCPNGHSACFTESKADRLERELREQKCETMRVEQAKRALENENIVLFKSKERLAKRIKNGVCPCCKRSFCKMQQHIKTKHPQWQKEAK